MSTIKCPNESCTTERDVSVLYCPDCSRKLSAVSVGSNFDSKVGSFHVHNELTSDCVSASFLVQAPRSSVRQVLREYVPQPKANGVARKAFEETVRLLQQVRSPQIITPLDYFEQDSRFYTIEDQVWEIMLLQEMRTRGPYSEREVLEIAGDVTNLLKDLRTERGPVHHGEISTSTLARRKEDGALTLMDFALLRDATQLETTNEHQRIATRHLAPYQPIERREGLISAATDVYTLGAMMFEMLSGKRPEHIYDDKKRKWDLQSLPGNESIRLLLDAMTFGEPDKRLQTADYVFPVLEFIKGGQEYYENRQYREAANQWKQAYNKAKTPALKAKIERAESFAEAIRNSTQSSYATSEPVLPSEAGLPNQVQQITATPMPKPKEELQAAGGEGEVTVLEIGRSEVSALRTFGEISRDTGVATTPILDSLTKQANGAEQLELLSLKFRRLLAKARRQARIHPVRIALALAGMLFSTYLIPTVIHLIRHAVNVPPVLRPIKPVEPVLKIGDKVVLTVEVDDPDSRKHTLDWSCIPPAKIEGNEKNDSKVITLDTTGLVEIPPEFYFQVTVTAADDYDKSQPVSGKVWVVPKETTPKLKEIVATPARVHPGESVNLRAIIEDQDSHRPVHHWSVDLPARIVGTGPVVVLKTDGINKRSTRELMISDTVTNESGGSVTGNLVIAVERSRLNGTVKPVTPAAADKFNNPPIIVYLQPNKFDVQAGETVTISAIAVDQNNDPLTYEWEPRQYIDSNGATAVLNTSGIQRPDAYPVTVTLTVKDGRGGSAAQRVVITVKPAAKKD